VTDLGGNQQLLRVGIEGLAQNLVGDVRAVGIGGVDEVDAEFDGAPGDADTFFAIGGFILDSRPGQPHGAEAESVHRPSVDRERS
jgi:hypothetical protein